jgi:hypothetical protein
MMRWLRRLVWLGLLAGAGVALSRVVARRQSLPAGAPAWTPAAAARPTVPPSPRSPRQPAAAAPRERWVGPVDGQCPNGYPIKANDKSRIFHVPGGRFYDRTVAERCYATEDDAVADGYRPAKA